MGLMKTLEAAAGAVRKFRTDLNAELEKLESEREALQHELEDLQNLPAPQSETVRRMEGMLDDWAVRYDAAARKWLEKVSGPRPPTMQVFNPLAIELLSGSAGEERRLVADPLAISALGTLGALAPLLKERLAGIIATTPWPEKVGPPDDEREARITEVRTKIQALNAEIKTLMDKADDAGIVL